MRHSVVIVVVVVTLPTMLDMQVTSRHPETSRELFHILSQHSDRMTKMVIEGNTLLMALL